MKIFLTGKNGQVGSTLEEDLKKWLSETKIIQNDKVNKFIEHLK